MSSKNAGGWAGPRVAQARSVVARWLPAECGQCGELVTADDEWVVGHKVARSIAPELTWKVSNWRVEHRRCSERSSQSVVIEKAQREVLEKIGSFIPEIKGSEESPPLSFSPSGPLSGPKTASEIRPALSWTNPAQSAPTWLTGLSEVPPDAAPPLALSPPHAEAVGSYGDEAARWIEDTQRVTLRWWQRLVLVRALEHRADGSLCWRNVILSASRRSGKSVLLRGLALWRMAHPSLFGEVQTAMFTASDMSIAREIQRGAWRWAEDVAGWTVTRANGKEAMEADDGSRWLIRAGEATTGYDVTLGLADECWKIPPTVVVDNLEPAMLERLSAQLWLISTAHRRATNLMPGRISAALTTDDGETLLLLWAALPTDDPSHPDTWRAASPYWSADRHRTLAAKYLAAVAGEGDAELGEAPMESFTSQYLNIWRLSEKRSAPGDELVTPENWADLLTTEPDETPAAVAVEAWFGHGVSVASAWRDGTVSTQTHPDLPTALSAVPDGYRGPLLVGASLKDDPALKGRRFKPQTQRTAAAVADLARLLSEGAVRHTGSEELTGQVLAVRTAPAPDGIRLLSRERADAIKAAVWALHATRKPTLGKPRIITPNL